MNRFDRWEKDKNYRANYYRNKDLTKIDDFFKSVIHFWNKDYVIFEVGSGTGSNLGFLQQHGFTNLFGIECNFKRIFYSFIDFDNIPIFYGVFKCKKNDHIKGIDVIYFYSALFLNSKKILNDILHCNPKYIGFYENFNLVNFNVDKILSKNAYAKICDVAVDDKHNIKWFLNES